MILRTAFALFFIATLIIATVDGFSHNTPQYCGSLSHSKDSEGRPCLDHSLRVDHRSDEGEKGQQAYLNAFGTNCVGEMLDVPVRPPEDAIRAGGNGGNDLFNNNDNMNYLDRNYFAGDRGCCGLSYPNYYVINFFNVNYGNLFERPHSDRSISSKSWSSSPTMQQTLKELAEKAKTHEEERKENLLLMKQIASP